ncbi:J domain-containing protein [Halomarina halobia]|uniref:J domain-containing protein n=1 Tax=Halomarina halobia TaxID=3033386 RepID=A0ABD6AAK4_9EURY|nr:J domain-containing protein [Halomarina sp. PSR21]
MFGWVVLALAAVLGAAAIVACIVGVTGTPLALLGALALGAGSHHCWRYGRGRVVGDIYERIGVDPEWTDEGRERRTSDDWHREGWRATVCGREAWDAEWDGDDWRWADGGWDGRDAGRPGNLRDDGSDPDARGVRRGAADAPSADGRQATVRLDPATAAAYRVLGVSPDADEAAVRRAYRERAKETHPDAGGSREAFKRVRWAYERVQESEGAIRE